MLKKVFAAVSVLVFLVGAGTFGYSLWHENAVFVPPVAELNAQSGGFSVPEELGWTEVYQDGMPYRLSICGVCDPDEDMLPVWFYNSGENDALLVLEVYDEEDTKLASSGFLKPGEYLDYIRTERPLEDGISVTYKVIGYASDTYESLGSVNLTTQPVTLF